MRSGPATARAAEIDDDIRTMVTPANAGAHCATGAPRVKTGSGKVTRSRAACRVAFMMKPEPPVAQRLASERLTGC